MYKRQHQSDGACLYVGIGAPESGATLGANGELLEHSPTLLRIYQVGNYQYAPTSEGKDSWYGPGNLFKDDEAAQNLSLIHIFGRAIMGILQFDKRAVARGILGNRTGIF